MGRVKVTSDLVNRYCMQTHAVERSPSLWGTAGRPDRPGSKSDALKACETCRFRQERIAMPGRKPPPKLRIMHIMSIVRRLARRWSDALARHFLTRLPPPVAAI